jgi:hypothetical protein
MLSRGLTGLDIFVVNFQFSWLTEQQPIKEHHQDDPLNTSEQMLASATLTVIGAPSSNKTPNQPLQLDASSVTQGVTDIPPGDSTIHQYYLILCGIEACAVLYCITDK